jgi:hypothetical protein
MTAPTPSGAHSQREDTCQSLTPSCGPRPSGEPEFRVEAPLQYEFQEPFIVDTTKIATKLDVHATPLDQALADTVASYQANPS